jgi:hypothetical protein
VPAGAAAGGVPANCLILSSSGVAPPAACCAIPATLPGILAGSPAGFAAAGAAAGAVPGLTPANDCKRFVSAAL